MALGGDLHYHLSQHGVFSEKEMRFYATEIILGLEHMHSRSVVYRDLKVTPAGRRQGHRGRAPGALQDGLCDQHCVPEEGSSRAPLVMAQNGSGKKAAGLCWRRRL